MLRCSLLSLLLASLASAQSDLRVTLDGDISEWPEDVACLADEHYLYVRAQVEDSPHPLQAAPETLALWLDLDSDPATGAALNDPPDASGMGVDLIVEFSPSERGFGAACYTLTSTGGREPIANSAIGLEFAPTCAGPWYEIRIARDALSPASLGSRVRGMLVLSDRSGVVGWSDPFAASAPRGAAGPALTDALPPAKPRRGVRVVSWNVRHASPESNPEPFARVLQALDPDIILVQEWTNDGAASLASWATGMLGTRAGEEDLTPWNAVASDAWGVAVLSRHPITPASKLATLPGAQNPVRFVAARVQTPSGRVLATSVHLKCCGGGEGSEEATRVAEAEAINAILRPLAAGDEVVVVTGDFNLVGTRNPLDRLGDGLAKRGGRLEPADALCLGDASYATWRDAESDFTPGRLDYALVSISPEAAFVFDTSLLTDVALARLGLDRTDTDASDHLPLVVDLRP